MTRFNSLSSDSGSGNVRKKKVAVGITGLILVVIFLVLLFFRILNLIEFLIADLIVYLVANYTFRKLDKQNQG